MSGFGPQVEVDAAHEYAGSGQDQPAQHPEGCSCIGTSCCSAVEATVFGHIAGLHTSIEDHRTTVAPYPADPRTEPSPYLLPFATAPPLHV
jgi:hypothetical protein